MIVGKLFNLVNEGKYKVLYLFGWKIRFRSRIRALRVRITELEEKQQRQEKKLQQQKQEYSQAAQRLESMLVTQEKHILELQQQMEQKLAALEQQASERFNALSCNLTENEKKWDTGLRRLRESVEINRDRLEKLEGLDLDTRCSQNADATREVSARLADLEQLNLGAICELNRQEVAAVEKRISAIESQKLDEACEQNRQATAAVEERLSAIESQKLDEACEQNRQATAAVEERLSTIESQKLDEACEQNRQATAAVEERLSAIESQKLDEACEQNREAANKIGQRVAQLEHLNLGEACARQAERLQMVENRVAAQEQQQLGEKVAEQRAALHKMNELMAGVQKRVSPLANPKAFNYIRAKGFIGINRDYVASQVENIYEKGISEREGEPRLVVSLTSYPKRMYDIHLCLYSLLTQDLKPDKIILWLGKEQFPHKSKDIPKKVRELKKWGLEIKWCEDTKSYKKLIPALQQYPDAVIVTADDDIYYPQNWLRGLWETHQQTGASLVAHRCHEAAFEGDAFLPYTKWQKCIEREAPSYANFMTGAGGILYAPGCFHPDIMNVDKFQELCPQGDDIWFWAMALLNGTKIAIPPHPYKGLVYVNPEREANANDDGTLFATNGMGGNDVQLANILASYPELGEIMKNKS